MGLTKTAISRPIFIFMLMTAAFLMGSIAYKSMRLELNPDVNFPVVTVTTAYPGAGPEEINNLVSRRIEEAISGVNGLKELTSTSFEGVSSVVAQFEIGTDVDVALNDVRTKVDGVVNALPEDALKPTVGKFDNSAEPVLVMSLNSKTLNSQQLRDLIDEKIVDRFAQIAGVASANVQGGDIREIQVQFKRDKLLAYGLGIADVQRQISMASINMPGGRVVTGEQEYTVRVPSQFETLEDVQNMVLTVQNPQNPMGKAQKVRLTDVADVKDTVEERTAYSRLNGRDTIVISVSKARDGNAVEIGREADKLIDEVQKEYAAEGITIVKTFEQAKMISDALHDLNFDLTFAVILVASIVFLFLHDLRGTIIVAIAIPTSIFATFISLNLFGFTINNMTMLALTLAVGVLVDDAIVVLENIYRHLRMGEDPREAAINGRGEIGLAAMAITFADVVVFLPIATMGGIVGLFFKPMAIGFVSAVLFSLFVSFTVTPMLASRWYRAGEDLEHPKGRFGQAFERGFGRLEHGYRRALSWALAHRWFVFIAGNATLFAIFMFIGGSFAQNVQGAMQTGMPLFMAALMIGMFVIALQQYRSRTWRFALAAIAVSIIGAFAISKVLPPQVPIPMPVIAVLVFAIVGFVLNFQRPAAKTRILANAAAFGLVFQLAAVAGFGFGQWKKEAVFKFEFMPQSDGGQVQANLELPPGTSLAVTESVVSRVENIMKEDPDVKYVVSSLGSQGFGGWGGGGNSGSNYAQVSATLWEKRSLKDKILMSKERLRDRTDRAIAADMTREIGRIPGANVTISASGGQGWGSPIQMSFSSNDRRLMTETVSNIVQRLKAGEIEGVINPDISSKPGKLELQIVPDRTLLADKGNTVVGTASAIRTLYQGDDQTKLRVKGKEYVVRVMMDLEDRNDPATLSTVPITFNQGEPVYLSDVATIRQEPGVTKIDRRQREEEIRLNADLLPGFAPGTVQREIDQWLEREKLVPEGVDIKPLGQADAQANEQGYLFGAIGIGLVLVYMLLASLYDNLLYPFIIQLAQPQAMVGAILALVITNKSLNIVGMIGIITLVGLVGKNAILLVDYTNTLRSRGRNRHDAIVEAGPTRLRPIMMTTLALILGTMPIALALGRGSEFRETLGITIIGGITLSTLLTLLVIPCSYTIFDDLSNFISSKMHRKPRGHHEETRVQEPEPVAPERV